MDRNFCRLSDIVVVGGVGIEYLIRGSRLPSVGEALEGRQFQESLGGKGAVQAVACARLGARVSLIAKVGCDERGERAIERLRAEGVDTRLVIRDEQAETGATVRMLDARGEHQALFSPGANHRLRPSEVRRAVTAFRRARAVILQLETPTPSVVAAAEIASGCHAWVILDPAPAPAWPLPERLFRLVDLVKPNSREALNLTGVGVFDRRTARIAGERLQWMGIPQVLVQAGTHGNLLLHDDRESWFPHLPLPKIDEAGAGDALAAALAVALAEGHSLEEATLFGTAAAALATTVAGTLASLPDRDAVLTLLGPGSAPPFAPSDRAA